VLAALLLVTGCSSGKGDAGSATSTGAGTTASTPSTTPTATTSATPTAAATAASVIRAALGKALLTNSEVKLVRQKVKASVAAGIAVPSNNVCGDKRIDPSDKARVDRLQAWWLSKGWTSTSGGVQVSVSSEVIAYRPGGVAASLKAYKAAPTKCPKTKFNDGTTGTVKSAAAIKGLPKGTVVLSRTVIYSKTVSTTGYLIAIPAGNVLGMLSIDGTGTAVATTRASLAPLFAKQITAAGATIGTLTAAAATQ
jgi:hypothetical protein